MCRTYCQYIQYPCGLACWDSENPGLCSMPRNSTLTSCSGGTHHCGMWVLATSLPTAPHGSNWSQTCCLKPVAQTHPASDRAPGPTPCSRNRSANEHQPQLAPPQTQFQRPTLAPGPPQHCPVVATLDESVILLQTARRAVAPALGVRDHNQHPTPPRLPASPPARYVAGVNPLVHFRGFRRSTFCGIHSAVPGPGVGVPRAFVSRTQSAAMSWRRSRLQLDVRLCRVLLACCSWPLAVLSSGNYNDPTRRITPECSLGQDPAHLTSIQHWPISFKDEDRENGFATVLLGGTVLRLRGAGKAKKTSVSDSATKDGKRRVNATAPNSSPDIAERAVMNAWRKGAEEAVCSPSVSILRSRPIAR